MPKKPLSTEKAIENLQAYIVPEKVMFALFELTHPLTKLGDANINKAISDAVLLIEKCNPNRGKQLFDFLASL